MNKAKKKELRKMWIPQRPEASEQCPSCPFRDDNDAEWEAICRLLAASGGMDPDSVEPKMARLNICMEVADRGDFSCHHTAYNKDMTMKDGKELRQCPGASAFFRGGGF